MLYNTDTNEKAGFWKSAWNSISTKRVGIHVVGGQNLFTKKPTSHYVMSDIKDEPGVVHVRVGGRKKRRFLFLGFTQTQAHERSAGKTGAGAVIGTILAPGIGTIIGGAVGAKKKDTSTASLDFVDCETNRKFTVIIKCNSKLRTELSRFTVTYLDEGETI